MLERFDDQPTNQPMTVSTRHTSDRTNQSTDFTDIDRRQCKQCLSDRKSWRVWQTWREDNTASIGVQVRNSLELQVITKFCIVCMNTVSIGVSGMLGSLRNMPVSSVSSKVLSMIANMCGPAFLPTSLPSPCAHCSTVRHWSCESSSSSAVHPSHQPCT
jgi:hypothetical protein